jgi:hypothetical protein
MLWVYTSVKEGEVSRASINGRMGSGHNLPAVVVCRVIVVVWS